MSTFWIVAISVIVTLLVLAYFPALFGWFLYGIMMIARVVSGLVGALLGKR